MTLDGDGHVLADVPTVAYVLWEQGEPDDLTGDWLQAEHHVAAT